MSKTRKKIKDPKVGLSVAFQSLEMRQLLSAVLNGSALTVEGSDNAETISVSLLDVNTLSVDDGTGPVTFNVADIQSITINANGGADTITVGAGVGGSAINGGEGNDTIVAGNGDADVINGGNGTDTAQSFDAGLDSLTSIESPAPEITVTLGSNNVADGATGIDFGTTTAGASGPTKTFTVTNDGDATLTLGSVNVPTGYTLTLALGSSIAPGASDTFTVRLDTASTGTKSGNITFTSNDANESPFNIGITGDVNPAPAADIDVSRGGNAIADGTGSATFGTVQQGDVAPTRVFTVTNTGNATLNLGSVSVPSGYSLTEGLSSTLAPGANDTFTISMNTTSAGSPSGTVSFSTNVTGQNPFDFSISGTVTATAPDITVTRAGNPIADGTGSATFGSVQQGSTAPTRVFTVTNSGSATLTLGVLTVPTGYSITQALVSSLAPGASDDFTIAMNTTNAGSPSGTVSFSTNVAGQNPFNFSISGTVTPTAPDLTVTRGGNAIADGTGSATFGSAQQGSAAPTRVFTVTNSGSATLTLGALSVPTGFSITQGLVSSLAPGASDDFTIAMNTTSAGSPSGTVQFSTNVAGQNPFNFTVSGTVNANLPNITVARGANPIADGTGSTTFGTVSKGDAAPTRVFTVTNTGNATLSLGVVSVPTGFSITQALVTSLAPGASDDFTVAMSTATVGTPSGTIQFSTNVAGQNPFNFTVSGEVDPAPAANITVVRGANPIADGTGSATFGTVQQGGVAPTRIFTVTNTGNATLTLGAVSVPTGFTLTEPLAASLAPNTSDTFTITMKTTTIGTPSGSVQFATNVTGQNPFDFAISGEVDAVPEPGIDVKVGATDVNDGDTTGASFGSVTQNTTAPQKTFTVTNTGTADLTLGGVVVPTGFTLIKDLPATLAAGESDTFIISMDTTDVGSPSGSVHFTTNVTGQTTFNFGISGKITEAPAPAITVGIGGTNVIDGTTSIDFGSILINQLGPSKTFKVTNTGDDVLNLGNVTVPAGFSVTADLPDHLDPGASANFTVKLNNDVSGNKSGSISFTTNVTGHATFNFATTGKVLAPEVGVFRAGVAISDGATSPVRFGKITTGKSLPIAFKVSNLGTATLNMSKLTIPAGYLVTDKLVTTLAPGKSDTFSIRLDTRKPGTHSGQVSIVTNDPNENPFNFAVTGKVAGVGVGRDPKSPSTLIVTGTGNADKISFSGGGSNLKISANGVVLGPFSNVSRIVLNAGGGNDTVNASSISLPVVLNGDTGNDVLTGGSGADELHGGIGNDTLTGGQGNDRLFGEDGNDVLNAIDGNPDRTVNGGSGTNRIQKDPTDPH